MPSEPNANGVNGSNGTSASHEKPSRVLVLGSGALQIGQAGEFDYSGSQALKALREDGIRSVLINPNIATIQTSEELADAVYFLPVDPEIVERVIEKEHVTAILLGFGGQTALNCGLALEESGVLQKHGVRILGTSAESIRWAEDRALFNAKLREIDVKVARSRATRTKEEAIAAAHEIGLPVILRAAFSLGGKGSSIVRTEAELEPAIERALLGGNQVLVEECLYGWKEIEYEVLCDAAGNSVTVCNMENVDPMGIHTGESIVVAPSLTLSDAEYQKLREIAMRVARHLGIVGECNVQYALDPKSSDYRVIEVNPRLSRSSALASKATGYPLAYVAAKIALGYALPDLKNAVTKTTSAFFEPALDYIVCKVPRWDFDKFAGVDDRLGTEMKSVGEVMAIGRSFPEALQKAFRMLEIGADGLVADGFEFADLHEELVKPSPERMFAIARAFEEGKSVAEVHALTHIDALFLAEIERVVRLRAEWKKKAAGASLSTIDRDLLLETKLAGYSDRVLAQTCGAPEDAIRARRKELSVVPRLARIDTLAAEYPAQTNYMYLTYGASESESTPTDARKILVLGSGPYRIGSSVEFDWCSVNAVTAARELGFQTILVNCNPETVSTDYDITDRLVFDELTLESVLAVCELETPWAVVVSMGGQTANNLALKLARAGVRVLGTPAEAIDEAEDREKFSALCDREGIDQPKWARAQNADDLAKIVDSLGGFPVIVRPSYVLSGAAMRVAHGAEELAEYLAHATTVSREHPVVVSKFESHARELEYDAVAKDGEVIHWAICEHVENAGVHSGDATLVLPPQQLYLETIRRARRIGEKLARALRVTGPFNVQLLAKSNELKVIECNLRASRSLPFVSKVLRTNFVREAMRAMVDAKGPRVTGSHPLEPGCVAVKTAQFSFRRLSGADPVLGVEMMSTGEVGCFGEDFEEALLKAMLATGFRIPKKGVLLSLGPVGDKYRFFDEAKELLRLGLRLYATTGTASLLRSEGIACDALEKRPRGGSWPPGDTTTQLPSAVERMRKGDIDFVINIPREYDERGRPDGFAIRRAAIDLEIPLITDLALARKVVRALSRYEKKDLAVRAYSEYQSHP